MDSIQAVSIGQSAPGERESFRCRGASPRCGSVLTSSSALPKLYASGDAVLVGHVTKQNLYRTTGTRAHGGHRAELEGAAITPSGFSSRSNTAFAPGQGATRELGSFRRGDQGLNRVDDPGGLLFRDRLPGCLPVASCLLVQGASDVVVELQALVTGMGQAQPKRSAVGSTADDLVMTLAVLAHRRPARAGSRCLRVPWPVGDPGHRARGLWQWPWQSPRLQPAVRLPPRLAAVAKWVWPVRPDKSPPLGRLEGSGPALGSKFQVAVRAGPRTGRSSWHRSGRGS